MINKEEFSKELRNMIIQSYDKGMYDGLSVLIEGFMELKKRGFTVFTLDTVIDMINKAKDEANKIPTTHEKA